jgi:hypothetical protein
MKEINIQNLKKAIGELPLYTPNDKVFAFIEAKLNEGNLIKQKDALPKLTELSPSHDLWSKIEQRLDSELPNEKNKNNLKRAISELPTYLPSEESWKLINKKIANKEPKIISINQWYTKLSYAASIAVVVALSVFYVMNSSHTLDEKVTTAYSEEINETEQFNQVYTKNPAKEDEVLKLVEAQCSDFSEVCDNDYFKGLLKQYEELKSIEIQTQKMLENNSEEITIQNSLIRIDKEKTKISKKIIQLLI